MFDTMTGIPQQELTHDKVTRHEVVPWRHKSQAACSLSLSLVNTCPERNLYIPITVLLNKVNT